MTRSFRTGILKHHLGAANWWRWCTWRTGIFFALLYLRLMTTTKLTWRRRTTCTFERPGPETSARPRYAVTDLICNRVSTEAISALALSCALYRSSTSSTAFSLLVQENDKIWLGYPRKNIRELAWLLNKVMSLIFYVPLYLHYQISKSRFMSVRSIAIDAFRPLYMSFGTDNWKPKFLFTSLWIITGRVPYCTVFYHTVEWWNRPFSYKEIYKMRADLAQYSRHRLTHFAITHKSCTELPEKCANSRLFGKSIQAVQSAGRKRAQFVPIVWINI